LFNSTAWTRLPKNGGVNMIFQPDEVTNLKKGRQVLLEINEGDIRILKRNFCGVYEFYNVDDSRHVEYFEDLNLFKNRYGSLKKKFGLYNISRQRLDIYSLIENIDSKDILKWLGEYGKTIHIKTVEFDGLVIEYYSWLSDMENTVSNFQIVNDGSKYTLNISVKNVTIPVAG
jgi:hypothetical protein